MSSNAQVLFLSHGGGPLPILGDPAHVDMVRCLQQVASELDKPSAILVVSAHWEEGLATITSGSAPSLIYDYYGFPEAAYSIQYPCKGEPLLAAQVHETLNQAGISAELDEHRGFDHGLFIPLKIMYPDADIPCVQLSLLKSLNPVEHVELGRALQQLDFKNLLIIGSGFSFHNMRAFSTDETAESKALNEAFEAWLVDTCSNQSLSEHERRERFYEWANAPGARFCHPREEHLLPLHVCYGAADRACTQHFSLKILNKQSSMYLWQSLAT